MCVGRPEGPCREDAGEGTQGPSSLPSVALHAKGFTSLLPASRHKLWDRWYHYPHYNDEKTGLGRLNHLLTTLLLSNGRPGMWTQVVFVPHRCGMLPYPSGWCPHTLSHFIPVSYVQFSSLFIFFPERKLCKSPELGCSGSGSQTQPTQLLSLCGTLPWQAFHLKY